MSKISSLPRVVALAAATCTLLVTGCETTGDPTKGGIFWSESKAQQRLDERQQTLSSVQYQSDQERARTRSLQRDLNRAQANQ